MNRQIRSLALADHNRKRSLCNWPLPGGGQRKKGLISRPESLWDVAQPGKFEGPRSIHQRASRSNGGADRCAIRCAAVSQTISDAASFSGLFQKAELLEVLDDCLREQRAEQTMSDSNPKSARDAIGFLKSLGVMILPDAQGQVESVHLWEDKTTDETLCILPRVPGLKRLSLQGAKITDKGLETLASLTNLEELDLRSCQKITDKGMSSVSRLTNLKAIQLYDTQIGDRGLDRLSVLKSLESLNIHSTKVTDAGLEGLKAF